MDRPTVLYILYTTVSAQQTNLLPHENASQNDTIFSKFGYRLYRTTSQCVSSYGCAITMVHVHIYTSGGYYPMLAQVVYMAYTPLC